MASALSPAHFVAVYFFSFFPLPPYLPPFRLLCLSPPPTDLRLSGGPLLPSTSVGDKKVERGRVASARVCFSPTSLSRADKAVTSSIVRSGRVLGAGGGTHAPGLIAIISAFLPTPPPNPQPPLLRPFRVSVVCFGCQSQRKSKEGRGCQRSAVCLFSSSEI